MLTVHMIGNAHLDPVWLWRRQQGADEALATSDALLNELVRQQAQPPIIFEPLRRTQSPTLEDAASCALAKAAGNQCSLSGDGPIVCIADLTPHNGRKLHPGFCEPLCCGLIVVVDEASRMIFLRSSGPCPGWEIGDVQDSILRGE